MTMRMYSDLARWWPLLSPPSHYGEEAADFLPDITAVECEHLPGDMRTLDLGRTFDVVREHDAIMYATDEAALRATMASAVRHCRPGGGVVLIPDHVRETCTPETEHGGEDGDDGSGLRYLEWSFDPDPSDTTCVTSYAFLLREPDGTTHLDHDRLLEGLFPRASWQRWMDDAGLDARSRLDPWDRDVFVGRKRG